MKNLHQNRNNSLISMRRDFHKYPEIALCEFRTAAVIMKKMIDLGYNITICRGNEADIPHREDIDTYISKAIAQGADKDVAELLKDGFTGFWADMVFSHDSPSIGFRFDMDALHIDESVDKSHKPTSMGFASVNKGVMHACGHDAHMAIGLGAAEVLAAMKDKLKGRVRFIFQPAEEGLKGGATMVAGGAVKGIDIIIGTHIAFKAGANELICATKGFLASTKMDVSFYGVPSHAGACPQEGRNALLAACTVVQGLHSISRHGGGATRVNVGTLKAGESRNIIPSYGFMEFEVRGYSNELNDYMEKEALRIIKSGAEMYGCTYETKRQGCTESGGSDLEIGEIVAELAKNIPYYKNIIIEKDLGACEDFTYMLSAVQSKGGKGTYLQVGAARTAGHHCCDFDIDEDSLLPAMELIVSIGERFLGK